jgi:REP element-mobilizing transposase RayT
MIFDNNFKPKKGKDDFGWHSRQTLPHLDAEAWTQFVTFRLYDSMPQSLLDKWRTESASDAQFRKKIERYLDSGMGECFLTDPAVAKVVEDAIKFHAGTKYLLHAWTLMPNHGHLMITPLAKMHLPDIMHSIKSFSAQMANRILRRSGHFWQHESFDRYIRDPRHFNAVVRYIEMNPVKAGLCDKPEDWRFGSAYEKSLPIE